MNDSGHPLWIAIGVIAMFPVAAFSEVAAAIFSRRVRGYIVKYPITHFLWFAFALFCACLLVPAHSTRHGGF